MTQSKEKNTNTTTAVILAAGRGSRMQRQADADKRLSPEVRDLAEKGLKGLIPVAGSPFLDYTVKRLVGAGIDHVCLVLAPKAREMRDYGSRISKKFDIDVSYAVQKAPRGSADAVMASEEAVGGENFLLCNCDNLYPQDALSKLVSLPQGSCAVAGFDRDVMLRSGNFKPDRIKSFAVLHIDNAGNLVEIVEKPQSADNYGHKGKLWVSMNLFRFTPAVFDFCRRIKPHPERGELELTEAVSRMIAAPECRFEAVFASGAVLDMTGKSDIETVKAALSLL